MPSHLDEMLSLHVGENGKAQLRHFLLSSMAWVPAVMLTLASVFTERTPEWRCTSDDNTLCGIGGNVTDICSSRMMIGNGNRSRAFYGVRVGPRLQR